MGRKWKYYATTLKESERALSRYRLELADRADLTFYQRERLSLEKEKVEFLSIIASLVAFEDHDDA
jgi:hypothetical protein